MKTKQKKLLFSNISFSLFSFFILFVLLISNSVNYVLIFVKTKNITHHQLKIVEERKRQRDFLRLSLLPLNFFCFIKLKQTIFFSLSFSLSLFISRSIILLYSSEEIEVKKQTNLKAENYISIIVFEKRKKRESYLQINKSIST